LLVALVATAVIVVTWRYKAISDFVISAFLVAVVIFGIVRPRDDRSRRIRTSKSWVGWLVAYVIVGCIVIGLDTYVLLTGKKLLGRIDDLAIERATLCLCAAGIVAPRVVQWVKRGRNKTTAVNGFQSGLK